MKVRILSCLSITLCLFAGTLFGQEPPNMPQPEKEHEWLNQFAGEWQTKSQATMAPDQPPVECSGTLSSKSMGGFWVLNEMKGDYQGTLVEGVQTLGYDAEKKKYVGTWIDSMTSFMWQYEGTVDKSGKVLTLDADGPNIMSEGEMAKYQDIYEFKSADEFLMTSRMLGPDGKWVTFMSGTATRKK